MRRRLTALAIGLSVCVLAVVAAYSLPSSQPGRVPSMDTAYGFSSPTRPMQRVVVATLQGIDLLLPVKQQATTAVAFHPIDDPKGVALSPVGERANGGDIARLADVFAGGGDVRYHVMGATTGDSSGGTAGLDVGAVPGVEVYSPVDGQVLAVRTYRLLGKVTDCEIDIWLADDPSLLLVITHIERPRVHVGDQVSAGHSVLGRLRAFPRRVDQAIKQFTNDAGDHVQLVALRITPDLAGF
jgi:hypothetical protein